MQTEAGRHGHFHANPESSMDGLGKLTKQLTLVIGLTVLAGSNSGCLLLEAGFLHTTMLTSKFFVTTPPLPISPYFTQEVEDTYWEEERYLKVPVLDPVEGENAPLICMDTPSPDEIMRALPDETAGGLPFVAEVQRNNVRWHTELIVDKLGEPRFYPMVGPARKHSCHYKCTVYYDKIVRSDWPIPFTHKDATIEVVYIDHDHLIRVAGPESGG
jgi:hypothetical protein